ncbi:transcriptional regulator [Lentzea sp. NBRC 105346]|uniref:winged helix-turn-helix domain-containing protein n=1 Tax=Lentzea sp. NBRC 105346 TaxID=3032205 RepID=UPI0024A4EAF8|nr:helix-turn-helix domain-containing protein [Lentzea sp. NBRC 105346]GLZ32148.1 transcriptional regulator [Lentzea sp. NBRC 105346]
MSFDKARVLTAQDLRAMSHPLRVRLIALLETEGPLTATEAAARLETTPANCSFHLRLLARHGFVEEAAGGVGRQRPWQVVEEITQIKSDTLDEESMPALRALDEIEMQTFRDAVASYLRTRDQYPPEWREAVGRSWATVHLTAAETAELKQKLHAVFEPYMELGRPSRRRPGTVPVMAQQALIPLRMPEATDV